MLSEAKTSPAAIQSPRLTDVFLPPCDRFSATVATPVVDCLEYFLAQYLHAFRGVDSDANLVAADLENMKFDVRADPDHLVGFSS